MKKSWQFKKFDKIKNFLGTALIPQHIFIKNQKDRVKFAEYMLKEMSPFLEKILFSGESEIFPNK